jgi:Bacterial CdiA-CT RNAse A domain
MAGFRPPGPVCATTAEPIDPGTSCLAATPAPGPVGLGRDVSFAGAEAQGGDGLEIVLTPLQLAAVFAGESIEAPGSMTERLWGGATVIGGALELVGAAALLLVPEPTAATKIAGVALGAHGLDTASTGLRQVMSGQPQSTLTAEAARAAALSLGVDDKHARMIGMGVDLGIPLALGLFGAARVLAIRRGAIRLSAEEVAGGHTIARHVGRTEAQLRLRLATEPRINAASTFRTLPEAERAIGEALRAQQAVIKAWARTANIGQTLPVTHDAGRIIGFGVLRATNATVDMSRMALVLRKVSDRGRIYFVLTAYPKP